nr:hypothetical protein [Pseudonocardia sp. C8]
MLVALGVVVQAAALAWGDAGLFIWIMNGGVLDAAAIEGEAAPFAEVTGFMVHGMNGMMVIPAVTLILLIVSFFAKVPRGIMLAGGLTVAVALQVTLGLLGHGIAIAGLLHGANALLVFGLALAAAGAARRASAIAASTSAMSAPPREPSPGLSGQQPPASRADVG